MVSLATAVLLGAGACGSSGSGNLTAPVPIRVASGGSAAGSAAMEASGDAAVGMIAPNFRIEYVLGDVGELPTSSTGFRFGADATVDSDDVGRVARALGLTDAPQQGSPDFGSFWQIGPTDGSAPSLTVNRDPQLSWWYSGPIDMRGMVACAEPAVVEGADGQPMEDEPSVDPCPEPEPPVGVPSGAEAESRVRDYLEAMGLDPTDFTFSVYADQWFASVDAQLALPGFSAPEGFYSPTTFSFGFGAEGALVNASGSFARPEQVGPYPLVDLATAFARLKDQNGLWGGGFVGPAVDRLAVAESDPAMGAPDNTTVDSDEAPPDDPTETLPVDEMPEPEVRTVTLVDVVADLWWAWDADGSMWLVPAYRFIGDDGGWYTVPAVTDEYLVVSDSDGQVDDGTIGDPEPMPVDETPEPGGAEGTDASVPCTTDDPGSSDQSGSGGAVSPGSPGDDCAGETDATETTPIEEDSMTDLPSAVIAAVGRPLDVFTEAAATEGYVVRVTTLDGEPQAVTMDYSPQRINVSVSDGLVAAIDSIG